MIRTFGAYPSFATIMIEFAVRNDTSILPLLRPLYPIRGSLVHFQCEIPHPAHNVQKTQAPLPIPALYSHIVGLSLHYNAALMAAISSS